MGGSLTGTLNPGYTTTIDWSTGWRLPLMDESQANVSDGLGYEGPDQDGYHDYRFGYNMVNSEMGHLFYESLGNKGYYATDGTNPQPGWGRQNTGDFNHLLTWSYWSEPEFSPSPGNAWHFKFLTGYQSYGAKANMLGVLAVHSGDVYFVSTYSCSGFEPPMANYPVTVKGKNRALPLKAQLFDSENNLVTDTDISSPPVFQVVFYPHAGGDPIDVNDDVLPAGHGSEGNQFVFTDEDKWQYNMKTDNYSASGTYSIKMVSGDDSEYMIGPACETSFVLP